MEDTKTPSATGEFAETQEAPESGHEELSQDQLEKISGGIKGDSTDDSHKDQ